MECFPEQVDDIMSGPLQNGSYTIIVNQTSGVPLQEDMVSVNLKSGYVPVMYDGSLGPSVQAEKVA